MKQIYKLLFLCSAAIEMVEADVKIAVARADIVITIVANELLLLMPLLF